MTRKSLRLLPLAAMVLLTASANAQAPGGGRPQLPPAMQAKLKAWRDSHKNVQALQRSIRMMEGMEQDPKTKLNKSQAHTVLAVINKWQSKPALTDAQAKLVNTQITAPLTISQLKMIVASMQAGRGGGFGGPGGGRPGGGAFDPTKFLKEYNPLNPATNPVSRNPAEAKQRWAQFKAALAATK
jgi:hypothetical protein